MYTQNKYLTPEEAREVLECSLEQLEKMAHWGQLTVARKGDNTFYDYWEVLARKEQQEKELAYKTPFTRKDDVSVGQSQQGCEQNQYGFIRKGDVHFDRPY